MPHLGKRRHPVPQADGSTMATSTQPG